jgi:hypothetical protein
MRLPKALQEGIGRAIPVAAEDLGKRLDRIMSMRTAGGVQYALVLLELDERTQWVNSGHQGPTLLDSVVAHWVREAATREAVEAAKAWIVRDRASIALAIETLQREDAAAGGRGLISLQVAFKRAGLLQGSPTHKIVVE